MLNATEADPSKKASYLSYFSSVLYSPVALITKTVSAVSAVAQAFFTRKAEEPVVSSASTERKDFSLFSLDGESDYEKLNEEILVFSRQGTFSIEQQEVSLRTSGSESSIVSCVELPSSEEKASLESVSESSSGSEGRKTQETSLLDLLKQTYSSEGNQVVRIRNDQQYLTAAVNSKTLKSYTKLNGLIHRKEQKAHQEEIKAQQEKTQAISLALYDLVTNFLAESPKNDLKEIIEGLTTFRELFQAIKNRDLPLFKQIQIFFEQEIARLVLPKEYNAKNIKALYAKFYAFSLLEVWKNFRETKFSKKDKEYFNFRTSFVEKFLSKFLVKPTNDSFGKETKTFKLAAFNELIKTEQTHKEMLELIKEALILTNKKEPFILNVLENLKEAIKLSTTFLAQCNEISLNNTSQSEKILPIKEVLKLFNSALWQEYSQKASLLALDYFSLNEWFKKVLKRKEKKVVSDFFLVKAPRQKCIDNILSNIFQRPARYLILIQEGIKTKSEWFDEGNEDFLISQTQLMPLAINLLFFWGE